MDNFHDGVIHTKRIKQVIKFEDLRFGNIHPTDIDGCIEYQNRAVIFLEYKLKDFNMPAGQKLCLERLTDDEEKAGKEAITLLCEHNVFDVDEPVEAGKAIVKSIYYHGKWHDGDGETVKRYIQRFIRYIGGEL